MLEDVRLGWPKAESLSEEIAEALSRVRLQAGGSNARTTAGVPTATTVHIIAAVPSVMTQQIGYGEEDNARSSASGGQHPNQSVEGQVDAGAMDGGQSRRSERSCRRGGGEARFGCHSGRRLIAAEKNLRGAWMLRACYDSGDL